MKKPILACLLVLGLYSQARAQCNPDTVAPEVIVPNQLFVNNTFQCAITLYPSDFVESYSDNCDSSPALIEIRKAIVPEGCPPYEDLGWVSSVTLYTFEIVKIFTRVTDSAGNATSDSTLVVVGDISGSCDPDILDYADFCAQTWQLNPIEAINWNMYSISPPGYGLPPISYLGFGTCARNFPVPSYLTPGLKTTVRPSKNNDHINGLTTYDLVLISKHLLGLQPITNPYLQLAADVNNSQTITTFDIVAARKVILGITDTFPNNHSWRFVPGDYVFPDTMNAFYEPVPDSMIITSTNTETCFHFTGIKVGDINGTALPNVSPGSADRQSTRLYLSSNRNGTSIEVSPEKTADVLGFQLALRYDPDAIRIEEIQSDLPGELWFNDDRNGLVKLNWFSANAIPVSAGKPLFFIKTNLPEPDRLQELFFDDESALAAEWYTESGISPLEMIFLTGTGENTISPIEPNPLKTGHAVLPLSLSREERMYLHFFDLNGKVVYSSVLDLPAGNQRLEILLPETVPTSGLLFYRVEVGRDSFRGKLLLNK